MLQEYRHGLTVGDICHNKNYCISEDLFTTCVNASRHKQT